MTSKTFFVFAICLGLVVAITGIGFADTLTDTSDVSAVVASSNLIEVTQDPVFGTLSASEQHQQAGTPLTLHWKSNAASVTVNMYTDNGAANSQGMIHTNGSDSMILKYFHNWSGGAVPDPNTGTNWTDAWIYVYDATAGPATTPPAPESWKQLYSGGSYEKTANIELATDVSGTTLAGTYSTTLTFELIYV